LIVRARIDRSLDPIHHFSRRNERFVRAVPASLRLLLIFQVTAWLVAANPAKTTE
jgi:hypothetical protein